MGLRSIAVTTAALVAAASLSPAVAMADGSGSTGQSSANASQPVLVLTTEAEGAFGVAVSDSATVDDSKLTSETFDFGDGSTPVVNSPGSNLTYYYAKGGTYTITETATDAVGNRLTATRSFTTTGPAPGTLMTGYLGPLNWTPSLSGVANAAITPMPDFSDQLVAVTTDGRLEHNIRSSKGVWRGWSTLSQSGVAVTDASIVGMPNGSSQIIEITSTGVLKHDVRNADGTWQTTGWGTPAGSTGIVQAVIAAMPDGSAQLVALTKSGVLEHNVRYANGSWQGWRMPAQPGAPVKSVGITGVRDGSSQVIAVTTSGVLEHDIRAANGSWQGWREPAGGTVTQASIGSTATQVNGTSGLTTYISAVTSSGQYELNVRSGNGSWSGWKDVDTSQIGPIQDAGADWFDSDYIAVASN